MMLPPAPNYLSSIQLWAESHRVMAEPVECDYAMTKTTYMP